MPSRIDPGDYAPVASRSRRAFSNAPRLRPSETPKKRVHFGGVYEMASRQYDKPQPPRPAPPVLSRSRESPLRPRTRAESSLLPHPSTFTSPSRPSLSRRTSSYRGGNAHYSVPRRGGDDGYRYKRQPSYDARPSTTVYESRPAARHADRGDSYYYTTTSASPKYSYSYSYSPTRQYDRAASNGAECSYGRRPSVSHYR